MIGLRQSCFALVACLALLAAEVAAAGSYDDFFAALRGNDARQVRALLARGFDPNTVDEKGQVALYIALRDESFAVAETLLASQDLQVDAANAEGETPLMLAALRGQRDWVERLLARGARLRRDGWTPLHYAASGPSTAVVELFLERGADIEAPSPNKTTPLMMAAGYGAIDSADLLLQRGASPRARNDIGLNAGDFARRAGRDALALRLDAATK